MNFMHYFRNQSTQSIYSLNITGEIWRRSLTTISMESMCQVAIHQNGVHGDMGTRPHVFR